MTPTRVLVVIAVAAVIALAHAPVIGLYFHADDFAWLQSSQRALAGPALSLPADVNGHFRPAAEAMWLLEYASYGLDARSYHITTLALHVLISLLVGGVAWRLLREPSAFIVGALLFGVNFSTREIPSWISAAPDLLFGLGAALALFGLVARSRGDRWLGVLGFALAVFAKESALILIIVLPLVVPGLLRRGSARVWLALATAATVIPHVAAFLLSTYAQSRFEVGALAGATYLEAVSALFVPTIRADIPALSGWAWLLEPASAPRVAIGSGLFAGVVALATRRLGWWRALGWATTVLLSLALPALSRSGFESRWLYAPWVLLAPLATAALLAFREQLRPVLGVRGSRAILAVVVAGHVLCHGVALHAKLARDLARDDWVRGIVEGAGQSTPPLLPGATVDVVVPFGAELRSWPIGVQLAVDVPVQVRPIDDRTLPESGVAVLDATVQPARWRRTAASGPVEAGEPPGGLADP